MAAVDRPDFPPGERFDHSIYVVLAAVVEAATGRTLTEVAQERVPGPLDLAMRVDPTGWSPDRTETSCARGHRRNLVAARRDLTSALGRVRTTPTELVRRTAGTGGTAPASS